MKNIKLLTSAIFALLLAACGGGGGGGGSSMVDPVANQFIGAVDEVTGVSDAAGMEAKQGSITQSSNGSGGTTTDTFNISNVTRNANDELNFNISKTAGVGGGETFSFNFLDPFTEDQFVLSVYENLDITLHQHVSAIHSSSGNVTVWLDRMSTAHLLSTSSDYANWKWVGLEGYALGTSPSSWVGGGFWYVFTFDVSGDNIDDALDSLQFTEVGAVVDGSPADVASLPTNVEVDYHGYNAVIFDDPDSGFGNPSIDLVNTDVVVRVGFNGNNTQLLQNGTSFYNGEVVLNSNVNWDATNRWFEASDILDCASNAQTCGSIGDSYLAAQFFGANELGISNGAPDYLGGTFSVEDAVEQGSNESYDAIGGFIAVEQD